MESRGHASGGGDWGWQRSPQKKNPAEHFSVQPGVEYRRLFEAINANNHWFKTSDFGKEPNEGLPFS